VGLLSKQLIRSNLYKIKGLSVEDKMIGFSLFNLTNEIRFVFVNRIGERERRILLKLSFETMNRN